MASLIDINQVSKRFVKRLDLAAKIAQRLGADVREEIVHAVDNVSRSIQAGEVVGLVGESGCGKSTLGRMVAGILPASDGTIHYRGQNRDQLDTIAARDAALKVQMIFQDPFASLNPRMWVEDIVGEAPLVQGIVDRTGFQAYLDDVLVRCGLDPSFKRRYPHQFSGGQRQRVGIARALAVKPEFIVCDESVAALDVSIQAQILNLFMELRQSFDLTYLFISHDLGVVEHLSDRVVIMYLGAWLKLLPPKRYSPIRITRIPRPYYAKFLGWKRGIRVFNRLKAKFLRRWSHPVVAIFILVVRMLLSAVVMKFRY